MFLRKNKVYNFELFWIKKNNYLAGLNFTLGQSETIGLHIAVYIHKTIGNALTNIYLKSLIQYKGKKKDVVRLSAHLSLLRRKKIPKSHNN